MNNDESNKLNRDVSVGEILIDSFSSAVERSAKKRKH
jgi:hypothetical protein